MEILKTYLVVDKNSGQISGFSKVLEFAGPVYALEYIDRNGVLRIEGIDSTKAGLLLATSPNIPQQ